MIRRYKVSGSAGQALAAMLVAQESNEHRFPMYGAYIIGADWFLWPCKTSNTLSFPRMSQRGTMCSTFSEF